MLIQIIKVKNLSRQEPIKWRAPDGDEKKFLVFWLLHILKTMHLLAFKRGTIFQWKVPVLPKVAWKGYGVGPQGVASPCKTFLSFIPGGELTNLRKHWNVGLVWGLHSPTYRWFQFIRRPSFHHVANVDHYCSFYWWGRNKFSINVAYLKQIKKQWTC